MPSSSTGFESAPLGDFLRRAGGYALIAVPILFFVVFFLGPLLYLFVVSLLEPSKTELYGTRLTLENYERILVDDFYHRIITRTLLVGSLVTGTALLIAYPVAMAIARMSPRWRILAMIALMFPLMLSNVVRAYGWIAVLGRQGVVNSVLIGAGVIDAPLAMLYSIETVVIGLMTILLPYMIISIANALTSIDRAYGEAAQSLGANPWRTFIHVTLPLSSPGVAAGMQIVFFLTLSAYVTIALLGGPRFSLLVSLVYRSAMAFQWTQAAALAFVLLSVALGVGTLIVLVLRPGRVQGRG
jgi:putative spermidine/putrescine transport system permease protein